MCTVTIKNHNYEEVPVGAVIKGAVPYHSTITGNLLGYEIKGSLLLAAGASDKAISKDHEYFFSCGQVNRA